MLSMKVFYVVAGLLLLAAVAAPATAVGEEAAAAAQRTAGNVAQQAREAEAEALGMISHFMDMFKAVIGVSGDDQTPKTVGELMDQAPGNVSMLVNAVKRADLQQIVANPDFQATIFCPTNTAFDAALLKLKITPIELYADKTALLNILNYHTISNSALRVGDLKDGQELTTVSQHKLHVKIDKVHGTSIKGQSETAKLLAGDIQAGKSIIHVIDTVLLPPKAPTAEEL